MTLEERARAAAWQLGWNQPTDRVIGVLMAFADGEREECAKVAASWRSSLKPGSADRLNGHNEAARAIATAIRNRKDEA